MKKNILNFCGGFFDDLDKLNQGKKTDEFSEINNEIYDEHDVVLTSEKNFEFFKALCKMCKFKYFHNLDLLKNKYGFTQQDISKINYMKTNRLSTLFKNVTSLDELKYFHNLKEIKDFCFVDSKIKSLNCPFNLNIIGEFAFSTSSLKEVSLNENLKIIKNRAFASCTSLKEIIIPKNIEKIEDNCFENCQNLKKIVIPERFKDRMQGNIGDIFDNVNLSQVDITYI